VGFYYGEFRDYTYRLVLLGQHLRGCDGLDMQLRQEQELCT